MLAFLSLTQLPSMAFMPGDVLGHTGNTEIVDGGNKNPNRADVNVKGGNGAVGQVDWKDFNVQKDQHLNFGFSGLSQTVINRVLGGRLSEIYGRITNSCINGGDCASFANTSKVILINPAGVMFGQGSQVDLNSFTISTGAPFCR